MSLDDIRSRMAAGLGAGDAARDLWHDRHVDADMAALFSMLDRFRAVATGIVEACECKGTGTVHHSGALLGSWDEPCKSVVCALLREALDGTP